MQAKKWKLFKLECAICTLRSTGWDLRGGHGYIQGGRAENLEAGTEGRDGREGQIQESQAVKSIILGTVLI